MAYSLIAKKQERANWQAIHQHMKTCECIELFPISDDKELTLLGVSIPFKHTQNPNFESELKSILNFLIAEHEFSIIDLYSGKQVELEHYQKLLVSILN